MPMPDPNMLVGKYCTIITNDGKSYHTRINRYDEMGLYGLVLSGEKLFTFAEIKEVRGVLSSGF